MDEILKQVLQALAVAIAGFLIVLLKRLFAKWGIDLNEKQEAQLESYARQAVLYVEEEAARRLKGKLPTLTPEEKNQLAIAKIMQWSQSATVSEASDKVKAVLPTLGLGATAGKAPGTPSH